MVIPFRKPSGRVCRLGTEAERTGGFCVLCPVVIEFPKPPHALRDVVWPIVSSEKLRAKIYIGHHPLNLAEAMQRFCILFEQSDALRQLVWWQSSPARQWINSLGGGATQDGIGFT